MILTLDANVQVAAYLLNEPHRIPSRRFLDFALLQDVPFFCPVLILPECAAAVARATGSASEAATVLDNVRCLPTMRLIALDEPLAIRAAEIAAACRLRGADAVYVAVAERFSTTLITWDTEMLERAPAVVPTLSPADWLARQPVTP